MRFVVPLALGVGIAAGLACGSLSDHPAASENLGGPPSASPEPTFSLEGGKPLECTAGPEGGVCGCVDVTALTDVPNLYFVLDRSGSMATSNKWTTVRVTVAKTTAKLGARVNIGAAVFPDPTTDECSTGREVLAPRQGDSPPGTYGVTQRLLGAALDVKANGGTPTAATLEALLPRITGLPGRTFVVLATDGAPNCAQRACGIDRCLLNVESSLPACQPSTPPNCCDPQNYGPTSCLDGDAAVNAVGALKVAGVPVFVIGLPASGPYATLLDELAVTGGTARPGTPRYYRVDGTDEAALAGALAQIAAKVTATCTLPIARGGDFDPDRVNVYLDEQVVPMDPTDGWQLDGSTVTLLGKTCQRVLDGQALNVRVVAGCPTVLR